MNILILYYSGVGNTKMVAGKIYDLLSRSHEVTIVSVEKLSADTDPADYDALVIGFPTIHAAPAQPAMAFVQELKKLDHAVPAFLFTTCGLYSANTLRIFAKVCLQKNIIPISSRSYRCAATDGILFAPWMKIWFRHEKHLDRNIRKQTDGFLNLPGGPVVADIPRFKLYSILNYPNKFFGQRFLPVIHTHTERCVSCGKCVVNCPVESMNTDSSGYPAADNGRCIHCYRCIHHCPQKALSLSGRYPPPQTLYH